MGRILDGKCEASFRGLRPHDDRNKNARVQGEEHVVDTRESHKVLFVAAPGPLHSEAGIVGRHERGTRQQQHNERNCAYTAGVGLGHRPAILRESPHFQTRTVALDALLDEADCAYVLALYVDDIVGGALLVVGGLQRADAADLKYEVLRRNPRAQSRQHIRSSNCLRAPLQDQNILDYPPLTSEILELQSL